MKKRKIILITFIALTVLIVATRYIWIGLRSTEYGKEKETIKLVKEIYHFDMEAHSFDYTWENTLSIQDYGGEVVVTFSAPREELEDLYYWYRNRWLQEMDIDEMELMVFERIVSKHVDVPEDEVRKGKTSRIGKNVRRTIPWFATWILGTRDENQIIIAS